MGEVYVQPRKRLVHFYDAGRAEGRYVMSFRQGARQFFERRGAPTPPLPYDAEVEYLESTGTQWIDTLQKANNSTSVDCRVAWHDVSGYDKVAFAADNGSSFNGGFILAVSGFAAFIRYVRGNQYKDNYISGKVQADKFYDISVGPDGLTIDGSNLPITDTASFQTNGTLPIFAWRRGTGNPGAGTARFASFKMWQGSTIVLDMIPVRFTNELGQSEGAMYDRVSGALFRNAGTGAFPIGTDKS